MRVHIWQIKIETCIVNLLLSPDPESLFQDSSFAAMFSVTNLVHKLFACSQAPISYGL